MGVNAVIPAAITSSRTASHSQPGPSTQNHPQSYAYAVKNGESSTRGVTIDQLRAASTSSGYGSMGRSAQNQSHNISSAVTGSKGKNMGQPAAVDPRADEGAEQLDSDRWEIDSDEEYGIEPEIPVTWKYMSRLYLLVPIITLVWLALLILLVTYAWPPSKREREAGQQYPHPFLWKPFAIGIFASCTVQTIRVPTWVVVSWMGVSQWKTTFISTSLHAIIHELLRMSTLPLIVPSPTSGFHSSYYLGLGWGVAEVTWGIVQGWEQLELYKEVMRSARPIELESGDESEVQTPRPATNPKSDRNLDGTASTSTSREASRDGNRQLKVEGMLSSVSERSEEDENDDEVLLDEEEEEERIEEEEDLERKVEILERMRARRDLEEVLGLPFPNIPFPLHLLWRLDTLLLNLGLTLLLSAFYFNSSPIYRHSIVYLPVSALRLASNDALDFTATGGGHTPIAIPDTQPSKWLGLALVLVALLHVMVSLVWKVVGRVGVGAVTWGGLIVALGSVFAGLGCWGGLV